MKKIKKTKLSQDETALAIKLTHRAGNPENNKLEPELVGYPFLIGLKTPLTCEGLYREVYVFFFSLGLTRVSNTHTHTQIRTYTTSTRKER